MSHFTVIVFGDDVEGKLEDYWELDLSEEEIKDDYRAEFVDKTDEIKEGFASGILKTHKMPNGEFVFPWEDNKGEGVEEEVRVNEYYKDWKEYAKYYADYTIDGERCGYYCNPNAKWDWFVIGGRWGGFFIHKKNPKYPEDIVKIKDEFYDTKNQQHKRACDALRKCDIDIEEMQRIAVRRAEDSWNKFRQTQNDITYKQYLEDARKNVLVPFAIIDCDGQWREKGLMGWFAIIKGESNTWKDDFRKYFDSVPDDTILTMVDCHI